MTTGMYITFFALVAIELGHWYVIGYVHGYKAGREAVMTTNGEKHG